MPRSVLGLGSNLGNRAANLHRALRLLRETVGVRLERTSLLYDSSPQYVTEQPRFLNATCEITTPLPPHELLRTVKVRRLPHRRRHLPAGWPLTPPSGALQGVEQRLGRRLDAETLQPAADAVRFGPRPIDIDLLLYYPQEDDPRQQAELQDETLTLPHPRLAERGFVLRPLADLDPSRLLRSPSGAGVATVGQTLAALAGTAAGAEQLAELRTVTPLPQQGGTLSGSAEQAESAFEWGAKTYLMGVVNMTPDSFSDGGAFAGAAAAVQHGLRLARAGVDILDIGGHSTRPGFEPVSEQEELERVASVIRELRESCGADPDVAASLQASGGGSGVGGRVAISVDTFRPAVAAAALAEGADIINDVSGGLYDEGRMYDVAAESGAPLVLMDHGADPVSLHEPHDTSAVSVVGAVGASLAGMARRAQAAHVPRWQLLIDPGLGFAKPEEENLELLRRLRDIRHAADDLPLLLGPSRKRFTGSAAWQSRVTSAPVPFDQRDWATAGVCAAAVAGGAVDLVRVHEARVGDAVRAADAVSRGGAAGARWE